MGGSQSRKDVPFPERITEGRVGYERERMNQRAVANDFHPVPMLWAARSTHIYEKYREEENRKGRINRLSERERGRRKMEKSRERRHSRSPVASVTPLRLRGRFYSETFDDEEIQEL